MAMILILGRYLPNLKAIQDSIPESLAAQCHCRICCAASGGYSRIFLQEKASQTAIIDLTSCLDGVNQELALLADITYPQCNKIIIHPYKGALLKSLQQRFASLHFVHLDEITDALEPLLLSLQEDKHLISR